MCSPPEAQGINYLLMKQWRKCGGEMNLVNLLQGYEYCRIDND